MTFLNSHKISVQDLQEILSTNNIIICKIKSSKNTIFTLPSNELVYKEILKEIIDVINMVFFFENDCLNAIKCVLEKYEDK